MPGFGIDLNSAAHSLSAIQQALSTVQNNIVNASTPGYAAERTDFSADALELSQGLTGGLEVSFSSTRDVHLDSSVRRETSALGMLEQTNPLLTSLQNAFSGSGDSGLPATLSSFSSAFGTLSAAPNDTTARSTVIDAAARVADAFNQAASQIRQVGNDAAQVATSTVAAINQLTAHIATLNGEIQRGAKEDAGVAANLYSSIESLSQLVNISVNVNSDGTASVLLGGQSALVLGATAQSIAVRPRTPSASASYPGGDAGLQLLDDSGADITSQATLGRLGAALEIRNQIVPHYIGNQDQPGELNVLAKSFAGRVNTILNAAQTASGAMPTNLFAYNLADDTKAAISLSLTGITAAQIASGDATSINGAALELTNFDSPSNALDMVNGLSFAAYYGSIASRAGSDAANAAADLAMQQDLTTQAQNQRADVSGVSLNDQAAQLLSLQQAYQATARIITVLDNLCQTAVNLIPQA